MSKANQLPDEVVEALRYTVQVCGQHGVLLAGFAFTAEPPAITNFGTASDAGEIRLYELLCGMAKEQKRNGLVVQDRVSQPV